MLGLSVNLEHCIIDPSLCSQLKCLVVGKETTMCKADSQFRTAVVAAAETTSECALLYGLLWFVYNFLF